MAFQPPSPRESSEAPVREVVDSDHGAVDAERPTVDDVYLDEELVKRLVLYAAKLLESHRTWRGNAASGPPGAPSPQDFVNNALLKYLDGKRRRPPGLPLDKFLAQVIRSEISHLANHAESRERHVFLTDGDFGGVGMMPVAAVAGDAYATTDHRLIAEELLQRVRAAHPKDELFVRYGTLLLRRECDDSAGVARALDISIAAAPGGASAASSRGSGGKGVPNHVRAHASVNDEPYDELLEQRCLRAPIEWVDAQLRARDLEDQCAAVLCAVRAKRAAHARRSARVRVWSRVAAAAAVMVILTALCVVLGVSTRAAGVVASHDPGTTPQHARPIVQRTTPSAPARVGAQAESAPARTVGVLPPTDRSTAPRSVDPTPSAGSIAPPDETLPRGLPPAAPLTVLAACESGSARNGTSAPGSTVLHVAAHGVAGREPVRTWVSGIGDDANPCSRTAPCKTFAGAISKVATTGVIEALDPAGFGAVTLTTSIAVDGSGPGSSRSAGAHDTILKPSEREARTVAGAFHHYVCASRGGGWGITVAGACAPQDHRDGAPAATLLLPYFDIANAPPEATTFTIVNATAVPAVAHVTVWVDLSPAFDFNVFVTGYDAQGISLYDITRAGSVAAPPIARTIIKLAATPQRACSTLLFDTPLAGDYREVRSSGEPYDVIRFEGSANGQWTQPSNLTTAISQQMEMPNAEAPFCDVTTSCAPPPGDGFVWEALNFSDGTWVVVAPPQKREDSR